MKNRTVLAFAFISALAFAPTVSMGSKGVEPIPTSARSMPVESSQLKDLLLRLDEINQIDKSKLKAAERKQLRKEARSIKENIREVGGGLYISIGAAIIIILLLILLL